MNITSFLGRAGQEGKKDEGREKGEGEEEREGKKEVEGEEKGQGEEEREGGEEGEEEVEVPEELEDIIDRLLTGLKDRDTVIRWSCAKGIGRVAKLLPKVCSLPPLPPLPPPPPLPPLPLSPLPTIPTPPNPCLLPFPSPLLLPASGAPSPLLFLPVSLLISCSIVLLPSGLCI
jgi:hypothetical protein